MSDNRTLEDLSGPAYDSDDDEEPRCAECGRGLYTENHDWDCSIGDEEEEEDEY